jgi:hypothetical protein
MAEECGGVGLSLSRCGRDGGSSGARRTMRWMRGGGAEQGVRGDGSGSGSCPGRALVVQARPGRIWAGQRLLAWRRAEPAAATVAQQWWFLPRPGVGSADSSWDGGQRIWLRGIRVPVSRSCGGCARKALQARFGFDLGPMG